jgi:hypothetical protein
VTTRSESDIQQSALRTWAVTPPWAPALRRGAAALHQPLLPPAAHRDVPPTASLCELLRKLVRLQLLQVSKVHLWRRGALAVLNDHQICT